MNNREKEIYDYLIVTVECQSYDELIESYKRNLHRFKYDMGNKIQSINPDQFYNEGYTLRELHTRIELLLKLSDFIDYVGALQGILK